MPLTGVLCSGSLYLATGPHFPSSPNVIGVDGPGRLAQIQKIVRILGRKACLYGEKDLQSSKANPICSLDLVTYRFGTD